MTNIVPISDLKNYSEVLRNCDDGSTVYLTKNGRGKYVVQSLAEYEKLQAAVKLLAELLQKTGQSVHVLLGGQTNAQMRNQLLALKDAAAPVLVDIRRTTIYDGSTIET